MIATSSLSMAFGKKVLFENVSLKFTPGNCYGLIGANGTGKSTFLKILTGELEQTTGQVVLEPGKRMGWLKQDISGSDDVRVLDLVMMGHPVIWKLQAEMAALTAKADFSDADGARLGELQEKFQELDGYSQESNAAEVLTDLGVPPEVHDKNLGDIDSALKVRVLLTQALFSKPDVLLLDEPTNNLDIPAMVWLEKFLADYEGVIVVVSHDRHFLNRVCNLTCDVDYKTIRIFNGSYDVYQAQEQLARAQRSKEAGRIERQVEKLKLFVERFKSNAARSKQATSREKQIAQLSGQKVVPSSRVAPRLFFKLPKPSGQDVIKVENVSFGNPSSPSSMTMVRLPIASMNSRSWLTKISVPWYSSSASCRASMDSMSRWLVGSSRTSTLASWSITIESRQRTFSPPESTPTCFFTSSPENSMRPSIERMLLMSWLSVYCLIQSTMLRSLLVNRPEPSCGK